MTKASGFKATASRASLLKVLGHVHRVVERRNTIPILGNVLIQAKQDKLTFSATDLDIAICEPSQAEIASPGSLTVPAHLLFDIVRKMPEGSEIVLDATGEKTENTLIVKSGRSRFTLHGLPETDWPNLDVGEMPTSFTVKAGELRRLIDRSSFAISTEETRYYLNGIYLHAAGTPNRPTLRAVATDGHRLAQVEMLIPEGAKGMPGVIWPRKTVAEVGRLLDEDEDEIRVDLSPAKIRFTIGDIILTSKLIDGTFPDYGRVIPQNNEKLLKVDRADLEAAVDRVATVSSERGRAVKMSLSAGKMTLSVNNPDSGCAVEELEVEYDFEPLDIGFNSSYLTTILAQCEGEVVHIRLADPGSPTLLQGTDEDALNVLMPMRV